MLAEWKLRGISFGKLTLDERRKYVAKADKETGETGREARKRQRLDEETMDVENMTKEDLDQQIIRLQELKEQREAAARTHHSTHAHTFQYGRIRSGTVVFVPVRSCSLKLR